MGHVSRLALTSLTAGLIAAAGPLARPVRTTTVVFTPAEQDFAYSGRIEARVQADLAFRVGGKVIARPVNLGDHVKAGEVLARLDPADLRFSQESAAASVAAAQADAANARADYQRYTRLGRASPAFLPAEMDKRRAALDGAVARLAQAQRQYALARDQASYGTLRADSDGFVAALPVQVGQVVTAGQTAVSLAHSAEIEAAVDVPENRLPDVRAATDISVALWSDPAHPLPGKLREIGALADPASRTFPVRVTIAGPAAQTLGLGMTATVRFARTAGPPVVFLPASALTDRDGAAAVWVLDSAASRAARRKVTLAALRGDGTIAVIGGLHAGEQVVTAGTSELRDDLPVTAWPGAIH